MVEVDAEAGRCTRAGRGRYGALFFKRENKKQEITN